jgi:CRP-like cAMP-binding protein
MDAMDVQRARVARDLRVFVFLQAYRERHGDTFVIKTRDVAAGAGVPYRSAMRALRNLERAGLLHTGEQVYVNGLGIGARRELVGPKWGTVKVRGSA